MRCRPLIVCAMMVFVLFDAVEGTKGTPGYVDLGAIDGQGQAKETVEINLSKPLLNLVASAARAKEPELADIFDTLSLIQVRVFERIHHPTLEDQISGLARGLDTQGWDKIAQVQDGEETVWVYTHLTGETVSGLMMIVMNGDEAVLMNVVGPLDPDDLIRICGRFNLRLPKRIQFDRR